MLLRIRYHCKLLGCILSLVIVDLVDRWISWFLSLHIEESFPRKILVLIFSLSFLIIILLIPPHYVLLYYAPIIFLQLDRFVYPLRFRIRPFLPTEWYQSPGRHGSGLNEPWLGSGPERLRLESGPE